MFGPPPRPDPRSATESSDKKALPRTSKRIKERKNNGKIIQQVNNNAQAVKKHESDGSKLKEDAEISFKSKVSKRVDLPKVPHRSDGISISVDDEELDYDDDVEQETGGEQQ